jgi:hypothetical protein
MSACFTKSRTCSFFIEFIDTEWDCEKPSGCRSDRINATISYLSINPDFPAAGGCSIGLFTSPPISLKEVANVSDCFKRTAESSRILHCLHLFALLSIISVREDAEFTQFVNTCKSNSEPLFSVS